MICMEVGLKHNPLILHLGRQHFLFAQTWSKVGVHGAVLCSALFAVGGELTEQLLAELQPYAVFKSKHFPVNEAEAEHWSEELCFTVTPQALEEKKFLLLCVDVLRVVSALPSAALTTNWQHTSANPSEWGSPSVPASSASAAIGRCTFTSFSWFLSKARLSRQMRSRNISPAVESWSKHGLLVSSETSLRIIMTLSCLNMLPCKPIFLSLSFLRMKLLRQLPRWSFSHDLLCYYCFSWSHPSPD